MNEEEIEAFLDEFIDEPIFEAGDWRDKNLKKILETSFPGVDLEAAEESGSIRLLGLVLGLVKGFIPRIPEIHSSLAELTHETEISNVLKETSDQVAELGSIVNFLEAKVLAFVTSKTDFEQQKQFFDALAQGMSTTTFGAKGQISPPRNQERPMVVRTILFFLGLLPEDEFQKLFRTAPYLRNLVATFDYTDTFSKDPHSLEAEKDLKCVEGVLRSIGLTLTRTGPCCASVGIGQLALWTKGIIRAS